MRSIINALIILAFILGSTTPIFSQNSEQIYQKGLMKEEGEGNLQDAIDLYTQIADNAVADKSLRAKALLHIGMCYEKMGMQEATKAYQNLVNNFPGQKSEVAIAKERLSRLIQKENTGTVKKQEGIRIKQLWKIPYQDALGTVTSDGQFRSGCDWGNGDLAIHNLKTGKIRLLTNNAGKNGFALESAISKNDKQVAYSWWEPGQKSDLLLTDVINPTPSVIYSVKEETVYPATWLSDKVLIVTRINTETRIADICSFNISDKTIHSMKTFEMRKWPQIATSPDEKFIAYDFANESHGGTFDINILSLDGKSEIALIEHPANDRVLGWMPGRKEFLFISDRSGSWDLWAIPVEDGETIGMARLVYSDIGEVKPLGFSQNGDCFFGFSRLNFNNYIVPFDAETGNLNLESGKSLSGSGYWLDWSPDGLNLIQGSKITNLKTSVDRKITDSLSRVISPKWSPDGTKILFVGINKSRNSQAGYKGDIYIVDAQTGQIIELFPLSGYNYKLPDDDAFPLSDLQWSLDGKSFFYLFFKDRLVKHNLETGEDEIIYKQSHFDRGVLSRSPDGKKLLFAARSSEQKKSRLYIIPAEGGKEIELCTPQEGDNFGMSFWSPDGKSIFFSDGSMDGTSLWRIPSEGGVPEKVWYSDKRVEVFNIRPDGKQLAITIREKTTVVKVIEGLVPELEKLKEENEKAEPIPKTISSHKVWAGPDTDNNGTPSPDGQFYTYLDQATGNVGMREFSTGKTHLLTKEGTWENPMQFTIGSTVSPNSKQVAYSWYNVNNNYEVRLIDVGNPQPKVLYGNKDEDVYPAAWSRDGKIIYARSYLNKTKQCRILAITIASGDIQVLKNFDFFYWMYICSSADNQFIAFDVPKDKDKGNFDIHMISTDGKNESILVEHPANDRLLGWFPDKNQVFFKSDRSGSSEAWIASVSNGKAVGEAKRLLPEIGEISPMGFTNNGRYYYSIFSRKFTAFRAPLDVNESKINLESRKPILGSVTYVMLSPDGKSLAYTKEIKEPAGAGWYHDPLFVLDLETGIEHKLLDWVQTRHPRWSPDGKKLLFIGYNKEQEAKKYYDGGIYSIEIESGKVSELRAFSTTQQNEAEVSLYVRSIAEWAKDQKSIYYTTNDQIINRDLKSGQEKTLLENQEVNQTLHLSNDGRTLLFSTNEQLYTMLISGGETKTLFTASQERNIRNAIWSPDGKSIFFAENMNNIKDGSVLWMISAEGKNQKEVGRFKGPISSISIHPNGKEIVLSTFNQETEIWCWDNLLSEGNTYNIQK